MAGVRAKGQRGHHRSPGARASAGLHKTAPLVDDLTDILDWDKVISRLETTEPDFNPGTANGYHAMTFGWLVDELVHRMSGVSFTDFVQKRIVEPLDLDGMVIGNADAELDRVADLVGVPAIRRHGAAPLPDGYSAPRWMPRAASSLVDRGLTPKKMAELVTHPSFWKASIPAMNGVFTARSLAKMYSALSLGGALNGTRLVSEEIVEQAAQVQMKRPDKVVLYPLHWRLGYHRADALLMDVPRAFGHYGTGGAGAWANPDLKLSAALVHNGFPFSLTGQARTAMMTPAVYESLGLYTGILHTLRHGPIIELLPPTHCETSSALVECEAGRVARRVIRSRWRTFSSVPLFRHAVGSVVVAHTLSSRLHGAELLFEYLVLTPGQRVP